MNNKITDYVIDLIKCDMIGINTNKFGEPCEEGEWRIIDVTVERVDQKCMISDFDRHFHQNTIFVFKIQNLLSDQIKNIKFSFLKTANE